MIRRKFYLLALVFFISAVSVFNGCSMQVQHSQEIENTAAVENSGSEKDITEKNTNDNYSVDIDYINDDKNVEDKEENDKEDKEDKKDETEVTYETFVGNNEVVFDYPAFFTKTEEKGDYTVNSNYYLSVKFKADDGATIYEKICQDPASLTYSDEKKECTASRQTEKGYVMVKEKGDCITYISLLEVSETDPHAQRLEIRYPKSKQTFYAPIIDHIEESYQQLRPKTK